MNTIVTKDIIVLVEKLISFETVSGNGEEIRNCFTFIQSYLSQNKNLQYTYFRKNDVNSLLISNTKSKDFDLLLSGHIDVVKGKNNDFRAKRKRNKIYGRGTIDMKGPVASVMVLMKNLPKNYNQKIGVFLSSDEEIDSENSTKLFLSKNYTTKFCIVCEESNFDFVVAQKGSYVLKLEAFGKKAHAAEPWKGSNAIEKVIFAYQELRKACDNSGKIFSSTINLGKIEGGYGVQFTADYASLEVDVRFPTIKSKEKIDSVLSKLQKSGIKISRSSSAQIMNGKNYTDVTKRLEILVKKYLDKTPLYKKTPYASDGRFFAEKNISVIEFGPTGKNYHGENEYVEIPSLVQYYNILSEFILQKQ